MTHKPFWMDHLYILGTILFTVCGQVALKWRVGQYGTLPVDTKAKLGFILKLLADPIILVALFSAFVASLFWMMAMTKFEMSYAYPFIGMTYILNFLLTTTLLSETFTWNKLIGNLVILLGIIIASRTV